MGDRIRNAVITIGTTPLIIAPKLPNGQRTVIVLTNASTGGQVLTIQAGGEAGTQFAGIILYPAGSWSESVDSAFTPSNEDFWAVASAAGAVLSIQERVKI